MRFLVVLTGLLLASCAASSGRHAVLVPQPITGPRVVALQSERGEWVSRIEERLRAEGFQVLRASSTSVVRRRLDAGTEESFRASSTRYVLYLEASLDEHEPCWNGTPRFRRLYAELVDTATNETMRTFSGSGRSEDCPVPGTLYGDVARLVRSAWR